MRVSRRNTGPLCVCSASLALGLWGLASAQGQTSASAGPPRIPGQNENGIQVYLRAGLKTHGPVVTSSLHAPLAQDVDSTSPLVTKNRGSDVAR
jgi:hypothetical protein